MPQPAQPKALAWFGRADELVGSMLGGFLFACSLGRVRFYTQHVAVFALFVLVVYRAFPKFLMQNIDGVNLYFVLDKLRLWRSSPWEATTLTPLESMTSALWFPLNPLFIPPFSSFGITPDPTLRVYLLAIFASLSIFLSSLLFYRAIGFSRAFSVGAAWLSFVLVMLQDTNLLQGINNVQVMAWAYVCLALLVWIGRPTSWRGAAMLALFQVAFVAYVMGDSVWHLTTLPVFGLLALAIVVGSASTRERWLKLLSLGVACAIQLALGTYQSLFYTLADTTRSVLPSEYAGIARSPSSAGLLFRGDTIEFACAALLILGLAIGRLEDFSARPRQTRLLAFAAIGFYVLVTAAGLLYIYNPRSPAFRTGYVVEMAYPLAALFMAAALWRVYCLVRPTVIRRIKPRVEVGWQSALVAVTCLGAYAAWHVAASPTAAVRFAEALLAAASVVLLMRHGWIRAAMVTATVLAIVVLQIHLDSSYGGGADPRFDGVKRMQLAGSDLVRRVSDETAVEPGGVFQGYVEDVYQRVAQGNLGDEFVEHWHINWDHVGNGQTLFSWGLFNIPTISEYDPFIRPLYYLFFTRLLNEPKDQQLDNYLGATRFNNRIMELMGVRYVVTDRDDASGLNEVMRSDGVRLLETPSPNLGSYSPTRVTRAATAAQVLSQLADSAFDPETQVVITDAQELPTLVKAPPATLRFERGGYAVTASNSDWSLIVLPIQYSHCFVIEGASDGDARLLRVNLAQTGLLFHGAVAVEVRFRHWPLGLPACQSEDYADTRALHATDLTR
jgi:hypothetical protein